MNVTFFGATPFGTVEAPLGDDPRAVETPTTVVRCSDLKPGQILKGHVVDLQTGERRTASDAEKRMYPMPWGGGMP
jgi:hypothetical protein